MRSDRAGWLNGSGLKAGNTCLWFVSCARTGQETNHLLKARPRLPQAKRQCSYRCCMTIYIGTSGWSYNHWDGVFYPPGTPQRERLAYYVQHFPTVEINSTYYRWPANSTFVSW